MTNGLRVARARHRQVAGLLPIFDRSLTESGLCEMMGDKFGLRAYDFRKVGLVRSCDPSMQLLAICPKQTGIRNILHQRMFEGILRTRWRTALEE